MDRPNSGLCCSGGAQGMKINENEMREKYLDLFQRTKKVVEHECDRDTNLQRFYKGTGRNQRTSGDHLNNSITKSSQNTKKSPGDLRRLAINRTPSEGHQLTQG